eukprot:Polyplicarium_translucidae@DN2603_c0_g1_i3.p1
MHRHAEVLDVCEALGVPVLAGGRDIVHRRPDLALRRYKERASNSPHEAARVAYARAADEVWDISGTHTPLRLAQRSPTPPPAANAAPPQGRPRDHPGPDRGPRRIPPLPTTLPPQPTDRNQTSPATECQYRFNWNRSIARTSRNQNRKSIALSNMVTPGQENNRPLQGRRKRIDRPRPKPMLVWGCPVF